MNVCETHPWCCFSLLLIHAGGSVLLLRRNLVKENKGVWRRRIYRKYASCRWLRTQDLNLRADVVLSMSRGPPGQWFPETEYWASAIFVGTSGIPPKIIYRSVKSYKCSPMVRETLGSIPGRVILKSQKIVLDASLLNTQYYKVSIKGKVEQFWERSSSLPYTLA